MTFNDLLQTINSFVQSYGGIATIIGLIVAIIGIIIGAILAFRRNETRIIYSIRSRNLIHNHKKEHERLEIKFDGRDVKNLTSSRMLILNGGKNPLRKSDLPEGCLGIQIEEDYEILEVKIVDEISGDCRFSIEQVLKNRWNLTFHHINSHNGILLHILHTAPPLSPISSANWLMDNTAEVVVDSLTLIGKGAGLEKLRRSHHFEYIPAASFVVTFIISIILSSIIALIILPLSFVLEIFSFNTKLLIFMLVFFLVPFILFAVRLLKNLWVRKLAYQM